MRCSGLSEARASGNELQHYFAYFGACSGKKFGKSSQRGLSLSLGETKSW